MKHGQQIYSSKDFYLSACLIASGLSLSSISKTTQGYLFFNFNSSEQKASNILDKHWSGELKIPTKDFIAAIYQLKTRMRAELGKQ